LAYAAGGNGPGSGNGFVFRAIFMSLAYAWKGNHALVFPSSFRCGSSCFIMGLTVASGSGTEWTGISIFLGLSIAAGHINQEISDHREDRVSGIRTYSTVLGPTVAFAIGQVIFAAAFLSLLVGIPSEHASFFAPVVILLSLLNVTLAIGCCWKQVDPKSVERYRFNYRVLYLLVGLCLLLRAPLFHQ
jgi:4-hydroxybenzoate polyprenyltransferase